MIGPIGTLSSPMEAFNLRTHSFDLLDVRGTDPKRAEFCIGQSSHPEYFHPEDEFRVYNYLNIVK